MAAGATSHPDDRSATLVGMTETAANTGQNPACPDYWSHEDNALERLFPASTGLLSPEEQELVDQEALEEYLACEGHQWGEPFHE